MTDMPLPPSLTRIQALPSWLLGRAAARGHRLVSEALAGEGMRMPHHAVLSAVHELQPVAQAELGRRTGFDPKDMVTILNDLESEALITRTRDPRDRRKNAICISAAGIRRLRRTTELGDEANDALMAPLSAEERAQLVALLARVIAPDAQRHAPQG
jgi:MarR family transcriptional regulator, lower aerobic nicotinate degradation pathway regulator